LMSVSANPRALVYYKKYLWLVSSYTCHLPALTLHCYPCTHKLVSHRVADTANENTEPS
jgi:hypothetical protein